MKSYNKPLKEEKAKVTPFVGVWIEIKHLSELMNAVEVTPFVGVWIEIGIESNSGDIAQVTPFVGVWIEINSKER